MHDGAALTRGRAFATASMVILTVAFLWPALVTGAPWAFNDTDTYYRGGAAAWSFLFGSAPDPAAAVSAQATVDGTVRAQNIHYGIRSVPYSVSVYVLVRFVSLWAPIVAASFAVAGLVWLAARPLVPPLRLLLGLALAATTVLPFFGALLQPDILTAVVVLVPIAVMLNAERLGLWGLLGLFALMAFATLAHYGNLPMAALSMAWLGVWGLLRHRRMVVALVAVPLVAAVIVNLAVAVVIKSGPSLAPGRYPILLARTIEDGPGFDYLTEVCPAARWAVCEVYETFPDSIQQFLWGSYRVSKKATPEQLSRISAEELPLLLAIVQYEPGRQLGAFLRNSVRQFFLFDDADGAPAAYTYDARTMEAVLETVGPVPSVPARLQDIVVALGVLALLWAAVRRTHPEARAAAAFLVVSLILYAAVCGGLSAPVARYQARLIWIVPFLGAVLAFGRAPVSAAAPGRRAPPP